MVAKIVVGRVVAGDELLKSPGAQLELWAVDFGLAALGSTGTHIKTLD